MSTFSSLFGGSSSVPPPPPPPQVRLGETSKVEKVAKALARESELARSRQLLDTITDKCFAKCVAKPSTSLSRSEEACLNRCTLRYMDAFNGVSSRVILRAKER